MNKSKKSEKDTKTSANPKWINDQVKKYSRGTSKVSAPAESATGTGSTVKGSKCDSDSDCAAYEADRDSASGYYADGPDPKTRRSAPEEPKEYSKGTSKVMKTKNMMKPKKMMGPKSNFRLGMVMGRGPVKGRNSGRGDSGGLKK